jgi:hypothetical protein
VKILRLTTSADIDERVEPGRRAPALLAQALEVATGEPVDIVGRNTWGSEAMPGRVARWLDDERPDVFFLWVNGYWYAFASLQLQMQERYGSRPGQAVKRAWLRMARSPRLAENRVTMRLRRAAFHGIGGAYYFGIDEIVARVRECAELALARGVLPVIYSDGLVSLQRPGQEVHGWSDERRRAMNARLRELAAELPGAIVEAPEETPLPAGREVLARADGHPNEAGHAWLAECQLPVHLEAWARLRNRVVGERAG